MSKVADKIKKKYEKARAAGEDVAWVTEISFRELISVYSHLSFKAIKDGLDMPEEEKELLQSIVQRLKVSPFANNNDSNNEAESTTWEPEHANVLLLTTMLGQSHTQVSVNVHFFNSHGVITVWDGESKFLITKNFLEGKNILRVFNKTGQNAPITDGLLKDIYLDKVKSQLVAESNEKLYSLLRDCLDKFVQHRRDGFHKDDFITSSWMNENGFGQLVEKVLDTKPCLRVCDYTLAQEQEAYQREGACGAKQSLVQLVISNLTTGLSDVLWFACLNGNQSLSHEVMTKLEFDKEVYDIGSCYDPSTNYRMTVPSGKTGYYQIGAKICFEASANTKQMIAWLKFKLNGYITSQS